MSSLNSPIWNTFVARLLETNGRAILVSAPAGAGLGRILEEKVVESFHQRETTIVVTSHRATADQWVHQLNAREVPATLLAGGSSYLLTLEQNAKLTGGNVLVLTAALLAAKARTEVFSTIRPGLLLVDCVPVNLDGRFNPALVDLAERSEMIIVRSDSIGPGESFAFDETLEYGIRDFARDRGRKIAISLVEPRQDPAEVLLRQEAFEILSSVSEQSNPSLAEIHSELIRELALLESEESRKNADPNGRRELAIGALLERIESTSGDSRASALMPVVRKAMSESRPCLVSVSKISDGEYVSEMLRAIGFDVALVNSTIEGARRDEAIASFGSGRILVQGVKLNTWSPLPPRTCHILWSSPSASALSRDLAQAIASDEAELVVFAPELFKRLADLLAEPSVDA